MFIENFTKVYIEIQNIDLYIDRLYMRIRHNIFKVMSDRPGPKIAKISNQFVHFIN